MGYAGVFIDSLAFRVVCNRNNGPFRVANIHGAACERASGPVNSSWTSIFGGESGPVTAWISVEHSIRFVLQTLTGAGTFRMNFDVITRSSKVVPETSSNPIPTPPSNSQSTSSPLYQLLSRQQRATLRNRRPESRYNPGLPGYQFDSSSDVLRITYNGERFKFRMPEDFDITRFDVYFDADRISPVASANSRSSGLVLVWQIVAMYTDFGDVITAAVSPIFDLLLFFLFPWFRPKYFCIL